MNSSTQLVERWQQARQRTATKRDELKAAEKAEAQAEEALALHILPSDAKDSEAIALWVRTGRKTERIVEARRYRARLNEPWQYHVGFRGDERPVEDPNTVERGRPPGPPDCPRDPSGCVG